ncbi:MAG TPA: PhzF family phenazine biosynthesis protein [Humisphaera sp.]
MPVPIYTVDAFTAEPFAGNPAAVCPLAGPADERWMKLLAREMNLSETAFCWPEADGLLRLRWFTPAVEVDLCGHATLATAHVLWETGRLAAGATARFATRSGVLTAARTPDGWVTLDFPAKAVELADAPPGLVESLGVRPVGVGFNRMDWLVEVASADEVRTASPDLRLLKTVRARGVILTAPAGGADAPADFVSRFFAPAVGVDEDPVTGSAHCALAPYWSAKLGRPRLVGRQVSARGGVVRTELRGDRVLLGGQAVTVLRGELA